MRLQWVSRARWGADRVVSLITWYLILNLLSHGLDALSCDLSSRSEKPIRLASRISVGLARIVWQSNKIHSPHNVLVSLHPVLDRAPDEHLLLLR